MTNIVKIIPGHIIQAYTDNKCVKQEFRPQANTFTYTDETGQQLSSKEINLSYPIELEQPIKPVKPVKPVEFGTPGCVQTLPLAPIELTLNEYAAFVGEQIRAVKTLRITCENVMDGDDIMETLDTILNNIKSFKAHKGESKCTK